MYIFVHVNNHLQIKFTRYYLVQNLFNNTCTLHIFLLNNISDLDLCVNTLTKSITTVYSGNKMNESILLPSQSVRANHKQV